MALTFLKDKMPDAEELKKKFEEYLASLKKHKKDARWKKTLRSNTDVKEQEETYVTL